MFSCRYVLKWLVSRLSVRMGFVWDKLILLEVFNVIYLNFKHTFQLVTSKLEKEFTTILGQIYVEIDI